MPITRILCCTDFSDPSYQAIAAAAELAGFFGATLYVVHVVDPVPVPVPADAIAHAQTTGAFDVDAYRRQLDELARAQLKEACEAHAHHGGKVECMVAHGHAAQELVKIAGELDVDLLVISTHGRTGVRRAVYGSVAEQVVRRAECPVLTVHIPHAEKKRLRKKKKSV